MLCDLSQIAVVRSVLYSQHWNNKYPDIGRVMRLSPSYIASDRTTPLAKCSLWQLSVIPDQQL